MSSSPQPGDVYEEPSGLIVLVLEKHHMTTGRGPEVTEWWSCVVLYDFPHETVPAGYRCEYPLLYTPSNFVRLAP